MAQIPLTLRMKPTFFSPIYRAVKSHPCDFFLLLSCHSPILNSVFQTLLLFCSAFAHAGSSVSKTLLPPPLSFPFPWIMPHPLGPCLHITSPGRPSPPEMLGSGTHLLLPTLIITLHMQSIANYLFTYLYSCETESPVAMGAVCELQK